MTVEDRLVSDVTWLTWSEHPGEQLRSGFVDALAAATPETFRRVVAGAACWFAAAGLRAEATGLLRALVRSSPQPDPPHRQVLSLRTAKTVLEVLAPDDDHGWVGEYSNFDRYRRFPFDRWAQLPVPEGPAEEMSEQDRIRRAILLARDKRYDEALALIDRLLPTVVAYNKDDLLLARLRCQRRNGVLAEQPELYAEHVLAIGDLTVLSDNYYASHVLHHRALVPIFDLAPHQLGDAWDRFLASYQRWVDADPKPAGPPAPPPAPREPSLPDPTLVSSVGRARFLFDNPWFDWTFGLEREPTEPQRVLLPGRVDPPVLPDREEEGVNVVAVFPTGTEAAAAADTLGGVVVGSTLILPRVMRMSEYYDAVEDADPQTVVPVVAQLRGRASDVIIEDHSGGASTCFDVRCTFANPAAAAEVARSMLAGGVPAGEWRSPWAPGGPISEVAKEARAFVVARSQAWPNDPPPPATEVERAVDAAWPAGTSEADDVPAIRSLLDAAEGSTPWGLQIEVAVDGDDVCISGSPNETPTGLPALVNWLREQGATAASYDICSVEHP